MTAETEDATLRSPHCSFRVHGGAQGDSINQTIRNPDARRSVSHVVPGIAMVLLLIGGALTDAEATSPCDDFDECKTLIEINGSDGDIGFHWLADAEDLKAILIRDARGKLIYMNMAFGPLSRQRMTETFGESSEPPCFVPDDPDEDFDPDDVVTLEEFLNRWKEGTYRFRGRAGHREKLFGETELTYYLPAAPTDVAFSGTTISWEPGDDLGECASYDDLVVLVMSGVLPEHPEDVVVDSWEIVVTPDVDEDEPDAALTNSREFSVRIPGDTDTMAVTVPQGYLQSLGDGTPVKIEVGAIGGDDNGTFTEADGFCVLVDGDEAEVEECELED
jgi:hypothetical protein